MCVCVCVCVLSYVHLGKILFIPLKMLEFEIPEHLDGVVNFSRQLGIWVWIFEKIAELQILKMGESSVVKDMGTGEIIHLFIY